MAETAQGAELERDERTRLACRRTLAGGFVAIALAFAVVAHALGDRFFLGLATEALILAGLAISVDLLLGYTGLLSLGQALFFGFGAYCSALILKHVSTSFWSALGFTALATALLGAVAGAMAIRARGVYFALLTFGLAEVAFKAVFNTRELGGSDGIIGIPQIKVTLGLFALDLRSPVAFFLVTLAFVMLLYALAAYLISTPFGRTLVAIRSNESRLPFLGFPPWRAKLAAFVVAAEIAALAGALYPMLRGFVSPELLGFQTSVNAIIMVIVGGTGTLVGALYGAVVLTALRSVIGTWTEYHLIVIGTLFVLSVLFFPTGLAGWVQPRLARWLAALASRR